ncbi:hypothetical protein QVD17_26776 [Tagetes erecta]|uniref:Uncharacterized protein n=1 Tax=Tagetes erecta TaxID=13708 RepID=A0AAD8NIV1_TARER|nr:hypothetical protein QVD17_26776 [Tagetes erecta]
MQILLQTNDNYCQTLAQIADDIVIQSSRRHQSLAPINHSSSGQHRKPPKSIARFANGHIHRSVIGILDQKLDRIWPIFSMIPHSKLKEMFNTFWTRWRWDPRDEWKHLCDVRFGTPKNGHIDHKQVGKIVKMIYHVI